VLVISGIKGIFKKTYPKPFIPYPIKIKTKLGFTPKKMDGSMPIIITDNPVKKVPKNK